jgi:hypothetical protein
MNATRCSGSWIGAATGPRTAPPRAEVQRLLHLYRERYTECNVRHFLHLARREHHVPLSYTFVKLALRTVFETFGLPMALYTDRAGWAFHTPQAGGRVSREHLTQVGRALQRLGLDHIPSYSPQGRGRGERLRDTARARPHSRHARRVLRGHRRLSAGPAADRGHHGNCP